MKTLLRFAPALLVASLASAQTPSKPATSPYFVATDALEINSFSIADISDDGKWLVLTQSVRRDGYGNDYRHDGDPTYVHPTPVRAWLVDAHSGARTPIYPDKKAVRGARFSSDGSQIAMLAWNGDVWEPTIWTRASGKLATLKVPAGKYVAETSDIRWLNNGSVVVALHSLDARKKARDRFNEITGGPVFVQNSKDPFLAWDDLRRMGTMKSVESIDVKTGAFVELEPEGMITNYTVADDGSRINYTIDETKKTDYEGGGNDGRLFTRASTGTPKVLLQTTRQTQVAWSEDGTKFAYSKDGRVFVGSPADSAMKQIAGPPEPVKGAAVERPDTTPAGRAKTRAERFTVSRFSPKGDALMISNGEGQWVVDLAGSQKELVMATPDSTEPNAPRSTFAAWSENGKQIYFTSASRTKWERGIVRYDRDTKATTSIIRDGRTYGGVRLTKDGSLAFLNVTEGNRPGELFTAAGDLSNMHKFVESNPQLAQKTIGATDLLSYLDADGHSKYAVMHYPANYEKGKAYPTVFIIYEDFFDDTFDVAANILSANGYLVVKPSVDFETGYPGEAWLKGVTGAANKLIEMGVADSSKLGVQGTSYGGYAVNLLITQTNRFKAAINISGKVDLISFYTDSPRLGVRNITAAERQQDRIGATLWQQPQKYVAHSAIMFADRITTPLMMITGQQDSNVPEINSREMYYALRRLGKEVVWVSYANGGHGGGVQSADDFLDEYQRMVSWYDQKLKKTPAKAATSDK